MCGAPALDSSALRAHASTLPRGASLDGRARLYVVHHRGVTASLSPRATWVTSSLRSCHFVLRSFAAVASSVAASAGHSRLWPRSTQSETLMRALISASSTPWPEPRPFAIAVAFVLRDALTCVCGCACAAHPKSSSHVCVRSASEQGHSRPLASQPGTTIHAPSAPDHVGWAGRLDICSVVGRPLLPVGNWSGRPPVRGVCLLSCGTASWCLAAY